MAPTNGLFWLISVPAEGREAPFDQVSRTLNGIATVSKFPVPDLRVGTLDALMSLSDDLVKNDSYVEAITKKIANQLYSLCENENQSQNILTVNSAAPEVYLTHFKWDEAKFPIKSPLREIADLITQQVSKLDEELKSKASQYLAINNSVAVEERKTSGNLLTRDLTDLIKPDNVVETEYLTTLFIVVPKYTIKEFLATYETFTEFVMPRSANKISEDAEYGLFTVNVFKKVADDYKNCAREKKFTVRDFKLNPEQAASGQQLKKKLEDEREKLKNKLVLWAKTNFQEAFTAWIHIKAIRVFVESILRYGLPPNFHPLLVLPTRRDDKKVRDTLNNLFKHLGSQYATGGGEAEDVLLGNEAFYPYVSLIVSTEFRAV